MGIAAWRYVFGQRFRRLMTVSTHPQHLAKTVIQYTARDSPQLQSHLSAFGTGLISVEQRSTYRFYLWDELIS